MSVVDRVAVAGLEAERLRTQLVDGGEVVAVDGLVVTLTNLPAPELNGTSVAYEPEDPPTALEGARDVFRSRGHPFFGIEVEVGRHPGVAAAIREAGLIRVEAWPAMAVAIASLQDVSAPDGVDIRPVDDADGLAAVRAVETRTFGTPPAVAERFIGPALIEDERIATFLARIDGEPVGTATGYLLGGTVGIFGVGVVDAARRHGIGAALTERAARAFGDRVDLAWLRPSRMALRLYERLGFEAISRWEVWIAGEEEARVPR